MITAHFDQTSILTFSTPGNFQISTADSLAWGRNSGEGILVFVGFLKGRGRVVCLNGVKIIWNALCKEQTFPLGCGKVG